MSTHVPDRMVSLRMLLPARALGAISVAGMAFSSIPPSSIVGAILWAGYFGNALVTHFPIV